MSHENDYARAVRHITADALREAAMAMVNIASPTGREVDMAQYLVARLSKAGFRSFLQEVTPGRPNAIGVRQGSGGGLNLLITGHMDAIYEGEEGQRDSNGLKPKAEFRNNWILGPGATHMKGGLAAALVAMEALVREEIPLKGDLLFGAVVGETEKAPIEEFGHEGTSGYGIGTRHLITHGISADYAVLAEPSDLKVCAANMGCIWARIALKGTPAHSAFANKPGVVNAISEALALQAHLQPWIETYQVDHAYLNEHPNVTFAAIRGGMPWRLSRNPSECTLYLDIRTVPGQTPDQVKRSLRAALRSFAESRGNGEPSLDFYVTYPPTAVDPESPLVKIIREAHRRIRRHDAEIVIRRPGADSTHLNRYDVPCIAYGPGGRLYPDAKEDQMYGVGEHVHLDDLLVAAKVYLETALEICNHPAQ